MQNGRLATINLCALAVLTGSAPSAFAQTAPPGLRDKSIEASWTEMRTQKPLGGEYFRTIPVRMNYTIYISSVGRPFVRQVGTVRQMTTAPVERVGGAWANWRGKGGAVTFHGAEMQVVQEMAQGAAGHHPV